MGGHGNGRGASDLVAEVQRAALRVDHRHTRCDGRMRKLAILDPLTTRYNRDFGDEEFIPVLSGTSLADVGIVGE